MENKLNFKELLLIFLLGIAVYFNSFWVNFIWDDSALISNNYLIRSFTNIPKIFSTNLSYQRDIFYRPLQNLTYIIDFFLYKFNYRGYHLSNILLHIFVVILSFRLLFILTQNKILSFFASLLYLVCPLWVESVTYISGRADILMAIFILLSFTSYIKDKIFLSLIFYILALLSKEASVIYPLLLILYVYLFKKFNRKTTYSLITFSIITIIYVVSRFMLVGIPRMLCREFSFYTRLLFFIKAIPKYLGLILFPINQHMSYTVKLSFSFFENAVLLSFVFFIISVFLFLYFLKKEKIISFFMGWFFIMLIPYSGIFPINAFFAEHFIYVASLGFFAILIYFLQKINSKVIFNLIILGYLSFFCLATVKYSSVWSHPVKFYKRIINLSPNSFTAYNNLAVLCLNQGNFQEAPNLLMKSLEINPHFLEARLNLARYYYLKQDYSRAIGLAKGVLEKDPNNFLAWDFLGEVYLKKREYALAEGCYKKAVDLNPDYIPLWLNLYSFYKTTTKDKEAKKVKQRIENIDRYSLAEIYFDESRSLFNTGKLDEALFSINEALKINHFNDNYYNLKGCILRKEGSYSEALYNFKKALGISPSNWEVYNNLGNLFAIIGDFNNAQNYFKICISLNKNFADAYFNLALLYFENGKTTEAEKLFKQTLIQNTDHVLAKEYLRALKKSKNIQSSLITEIK